MLRRLAFVPLAALGAATALLVSGAGGAITSLVRVQPTGVEPNGTLRDLAMTDDGSCVVGETTATNDVGTDNNGSSNDIVLFQRSSGTWTRITNGNAGSSDPSISDDCNLIVFSTGATDLVTPDTNGTTDVIVFDRSTSTFSRLTPNAGSPEVSGNGQFVAVLDFFSFQILRLPSGGGSPVPVSVSSGGVPGNSSTFAPTISDDGALIAFMSHSNNLVPGDANAKPDIFLRDVAASTTELVSQAPGGGFAPNPGAGFGGSLAPDISGSGRYVAFESDLPGITGGNFGPVSVRRDLQTDTSTVLAGNDGTLDVNDAGVVAVATYEPFDPADTGSDPDIYLLGATAEWVSQQAGGGAPSGGFYPFVGGGLVSEDGSVVAFTSTRTNLVAGDANNCEDGFVVVLGTGGGGSTSGSTTATTAAPTTTLITTPVTVPLFRPPDVKLELTVEPAAPLKGESYAPGELFAIELTVKNVGTDTAHGALVNQTLTVQGAGGRPVETTFPDPQCAVLEGEGGVTTFICSAGNLAPGASKTFSVLVRVHAEATAFASTVARSEETVTETQSHELAIDDGSRACATGESCESGPGTTTTTCVDDAVCKYGGEGVMNTVCRGDAVCGGGPLRELHACSAGATCKDRLGEPNVFRCTGEGTYCAGVGTFTCTDGARCVANGESNGRCEESSCSWGESDNESVVCVESTCWLNGGDDTARCSADSTCKYGSGNDEVVCRSGSSCFAGGGRDELDCAGRDTTCNAGLGRDDAACAAGATCMVWGSGSEVTCRDGSVELNSPRSTAFMTDCTAEVCDCASAATSDFYVNRHSKIAARRLARPDIRLVGPGSVVTVQRSSIVQIGNRKPNVLSFADVTDALGTVIADARDRVSTRTRVILDNVNDEFSDEEEEEEEEVFDTEQHPWHVPSNVHIITVDEPAPGNASFGAIRIPVERVRPGGDVGVVLVPENVPRGLVLGGTIARTDAAIGGNGLGDGTVVVRTHLAPHVFETKGRPAGRFSFDVALSATNASTIGGLSSDPGAMRVGVYLFDEASGRPLTTSGGSPCTSCTVTLAPGERKSSLSVDNLASADRSDLGRLARLGYSVLTVDGRPEQVRVQSFVVNAHTSAFDLSVFGFVPETLQAP